MFGDKKRLLRLAKLLRIPRLVSLLDIDRFNERMARFLKRQEDKMTKENGSVPIKQKLVLVSICRVLSLTFTILISSYFLAVVWYIFVNDYEMADGNFSQTFEIEGQKAWTQLITVWYFILSTLTTVGFGDFHPVTTAEKLLTTVILLLGVSFFFFHPRKLDRDNRQI